MRGDELNARHQYSLKRLRGAPENVWLMKINICPIRSEKPLNNSGA
jgi:hypothetical protein